MPLWASWLRDFDILILFYDEFKSEKMEKFETLIVPRGLNDLDLSLSLTEGWGGGGRRLQTMMTGQSFWAQKMSKKSTPGPSYGGLKKGMAKSAKMPCWLPSLNSCHGPKFKNFCAHQIANDQMILDPSYGRLKNTKYVTKWGVPSLNSRHGPNFWRNLKHSAPIR